MHKIGDDTATADANGEFKETPTPTDLRAATANTWQRELVKIVEGAGLVLDGANDEQIWSVLKNAVQFFPHGAAVPNMTVVIEPGKIWSGQKYIDQGGQATALIVAPITNPRIDRIAIDITTGLYTVITGTEAAVPIASAYGENQYPICQFQLVTTTTTLSLAAQSTTNSHIIDERPTISDKEGPDVAGYVKGTMQYVEGDTGQNATAFDIKTNIGITWESVGPTGSGAANIWSALDGIPAGAKYVTVKIYGRTNAAATATQIKIHARKTGSTTFPTLDEGLFYDHTVIYQSYFFDAGNTNPDIINLSGVEFIPIDSSNRFDLGLPVANGGDAYMILVGPGV